VPALHLATAGDEKLEAQAEAVQGRMAGAEGPDAGRGKAQAPQVVVVLDRLRGDVVAEPLRLLVRIRVAADFEQQGGVVDGRPLLLVEPECLGQPQRDHALAERVLHRLPEAEIDPQRQRGHELRQPNALPIGHAADTRVHVGANDTARATRR
jgi:hypothetical protein